MSRLKKGEKQSTPNTQIILRILYNIIKNKTLEFSLDSLATSDPANAKIKRQKIFCEFPIY